MGVEQIIAAVVAFATGVGGLGYLLDRRGQREAAIWRGIAEARAAENHDCTERLDRVEAELRVMREAWVQGAVTTIAAGVIGAVTDEVSRRRQWEREQTQRAEENRG